METFVCYEKNLHKIFITCFKSDIKDEGNLAIAYVTKSL